MNYQEVVEAIEKKRRFGSETGVEVSSEMLRVLHDPQAGMPWIHIAGTNGKGSVSAFLCRILEEAGLRAGMFTSPHLIDFRERIRVNGAFITREAVARIGADLLQRDWAICPTMFDYCMLMAVLYFREQNCDVAIMETGLGGRLDSTNALGVPDVAVITRIGYDHMNILGDTLEKIAVEKAGIIKRGASLILAPQEPSAMRVCEEEARRRQVRVRKAKPCDWSIEGFDGERQYFSCGDYKHLSMGLLGVHQYENAAVAILAAEEFFKKNRGLLRGRKKEKFSDGKGGDTSAQQDMLKNIVQNGIAGTRWEGRMQILRREPFLMVDGAHNANGAMALKEGLTYLFPGEKFHFLMGVMADKNYEEMVKALEPLALDFSTVTVASERSLHASRLAEYIGSRGIPASWHDTLEDALCYMERCGNGKCVAFGSLYFVGALLELFLSKRVDK